MSTYYNVYAINGRTGRITARTGAPDYDTAIHYACGLSIGARAFQKSAFTAIYEAGGKLVHTCDYFSDYKPISGTEAGLMEAANQPNCNKLNELRKEKQNLLEQGCRQF